jgi:hypothetical protein
LAAKGGAMSAGNVIRIYLFPLILLFLNAASAGNQLIFYSQPSATAQENLDYCTRKISPARTVIPLIGEYAVIDPSSGHQVGKVNIPSVFHSREEIIFRKQFDLGKSVGQPAALHLEKVVGWIEIRLNQKVIFRGSQNFLPLEIPVPAELLNEKGNVFDIKIRPWGTSRDQLPFWTPINLPRIESGIGGPVYLEILPPLYIESTHMDIQTSKEGTTLAGDVHLIGTKSGSDKRELEVSVYQAKNLIKSVLISVKSDSLLKSQTFPFQIKNLQLQPWSPEKPERYFLQFTLTEGEQILDRMNRPVVLRQVYFSGKQLMVNNQTVELNGLNYIYQDVQGRSLLNRQRVLEDLEFIRAQGFNAIRVGFFPQFETLYDLADSLGLLCLQDLPFPFLKMSVHNDTSQHMMINSYLKDFLQLTARHPSLVGIGFGNYYREIDEASRRAWQEMHQTITQSRQIIVYACTFNPALMEKDLFDYYCLEILERNHQEEYLTEIKGLLKPEIPVFVSGLSKSVSYRVDSTAIIQDLSQMTELYQRIEYSDFKNLFTGQFILTYSAYYLETPSLQAGPANDFILNAIGICDIKRNFKPEAKQTLRHTRIMSATDLDQESGTGFGSYFFIIFGLVNFLIFAVTYRTFIDFRRNINRAIRKPHGFFMDLQERRLIAYGQSFFLMIIMSVNAAVMIGGILFFFRNNLYLDYFLSLLFPSDSLKLMIAELIWKPLYLIPVLVLVVILIFLVFALPVRILSLFRDSKVRARQSIAVSTWAAAPFLLLLPIGMFFYNLLIVLNSYWILFAVLLYFHVWYFVRWMSGTRVMTALSYTRVFLFCLFLLAIVSGGIIYYLESKIDLFAHLNFLFHLFYFHV